MHVFFKYFGEARRDRDSREKSRCDPDTMNYPTIKSPYRLIRKFNLNSILRSLISYVRLAQAILRFVLMSPET